MADAMQLGGEDDPMHPGLEELRVRGILKRVVAIGGESTGWAIDLDLPVKVENQEISQVEINHDANRWSKFNDQHVEATGELTFRDGVERGSWPVLEVESMRAI